MALMSASLASWDTLSCSNPSARARLPSAACFSSASWRAGSNKFSSSSRRTHTDWMPVR